MSFRKGDLVTWFHDEIDSCPVTAHNGVVTSVNNTGLTFVEIEDLANGKIYRPSPSELIRIEPDADHRA